MTTIIIDRAVVEQALEAFDGGSWEQLRAAEALRAALAEQPAEQSAEHGEPVAKDWIVFNTGAEVWSGLSLEEAVAELTPQRIDRGWSAVCVINKDNPPLYTAPPPAKPAERVPLTDDEIDVIVVDVLGLDADEDAMQDFARAIEAKILEQFK